ncbi:Wzz/FepE/Etk N-terminal domain-containing protein [Streptomyces sp. CAU 1734]|uniref:Wzz/FepE/Etk N-terminal domain-containing protein n=1 Tax=Streptomyces sp. CAU 1734 TaxID=3140360 RepID=UPI00326084C3
MTTSTTAESSAATPLLDLQALLVAVRRRHRLWSVMALVGLLAGAALAVLFPPPPSAMTKVLVAHREDQPNDSGTLIRTDIALLGTTRIAGMALKSLKSADDPEDFLQEYRGTGLTNNLMQIDVTAGTEAEAVARAGALADAFIADHVRRMWESARAEAKSLLDQRDRMRAELTRVNKEIGKGTPESDPKESASTESLFARRAELNSRIAEFDQRAAEASTGTPQVIAGTQIVDAPRAVRGSLPRTAVTNAAIGLVLGLVLGLAVAAIGTAVADRPVLRREIAANLGASVIAELRRSPHRSPGLWQRGCTRAARERLTTTLARTVRGSAEPVSLLELGCARGASVIALNVAGALAAEGPVTVIDGLPGRELTRTRREPGGPAVITGDHAATAPAQGRTLGVGSVAPGTAWTDLQYLGGRTVLVVRAGHGSAAWLHTVARQLAEQRIAVIGVVLIDPDPGDRTDGTLWDGLHTALRAPHERPARQHGAGQPRADRPARQHGTSQLRTERPSIPAALVPDSDQEAR